MLTMKPPKIICDLFLNKWFYNFITLEKHTFPLSLNIYLRTKKAFEGPGLKFQS